jgi:hypothetical protein
VLLVGLALSASASASASLTPFNRDYGDVKVDSTSSARVFHLTVVCDDNPSLLFYQCANVGGDPPLPVSISVGKSFKQTNDCPAAMPRTGTGITGTEPLTTTCRINVTFAPTEAGKLKAVVDTGDTLENPVAAVSGTGVTPAAAAKKKKCKRKSKWPKRKRCRKKKEGG